MKTKQLPFQLFCIFLSINAHAMDQSDNQLASPHTLAQQLRASQDTVAASHEQLDSQLAEIKEARQNNLAFAKRSIATLTILGASCYAFKTIQRPPATRFISAAMTTGSLALSACQGVAGCAAVGIGYYQLHKLIYSGCITEREFDALKNTYKEALTNLQAQQAAQTNAINNHAAELDDHQKQLTFLTTEQIELNRVATAHAKDLDAGRICARRTEKALKEQGEAVNNHASLIKQLNTSSNPTTIIPEQIIDPNSGVSAQAAVPQNIPDMPAQNSFQEAARVEPISTNSNFWPSSCCRDDAIKIKGKK